MTAAQILRLQKTPFKRAAFFFTFDALWSSLSMYLAWILTQNVENVTIEKLFPVLVLVIPIHWLVNYIFRLYNFIWRYVSIREMLHTIYGITTSLILIWAVALFWPGPVPSRTLFAYSLLVYLGFSGIRASRRIYYLFLKPNVTGKHRRTLIVGAGNAGERLVRDIRHSEMSPYFVVGLVDDDSTKRGTFVHGVRVIGKCDDIPKLTRVNKVNTIIIAIPTATSSQIKQILLQCRQANIKDIRIVPSIFSTDNSSLEIKPIAIEDLLGREPVDLDLSGIEKFFQGKTVLVTGAAGSIGEELAKQIFGFAPQRLILFEIDESRLFEAEQNLLGIPSDVDMIPVVGDITDKSKVHRIFEKYRPDIVYHAAAYKHVPIMEYYPEEAIKTNIFGTLNLVETSLEFNVERFLLVSTDKAVNPTSVMGATKRVAENIIREHQKYALAKGLRTIFMAVRFGNVLGSRGSVVPTFQKQIQDGGPVTITHPDMKRYFMTIKESVLLILESSRIGKGAEVFVLDMGEPVLILDLAKEMIRLHGLEPDTDIPISITGLRSGEKLFEELLTAEEGTDATTHKKIFVARISKEVPWESTRLILNQLVSVCQNGADTVSLKKLLKQAVPNYNLNNVNQFVVVT